MTDLLPFLIVGTVSGSLYGLAGTGLVLTYRTSGVFNFGHGAIAASAAFIFYNLHVTHGVPWPVALALTVGVFGPLCGVLVELVVRRLVGAPQALVIIGTVGIFLAVDGFLLVQSGSVTRHFPSFLPTSGIDVADVTITYAQQISIAVSLAASLGLYVYLHRSRAGVAMRAVVDNPTLTQLAGEEPVRLRRMSWMIGCSFAALTGVLIAPTLGLDANLLTLLIVQTFGACAIGRFSSLPLTFAGGVLVGILQALATKYFEAPPLSGLSASMPFLVLVVVLLVTPRRGFPERQTARPSTAVASRTRRATPWVSGVTVAALLLVPSVVGTDLPLWINAMTTAVLLGSLALLVLASGQISLCHAAFAAFGATTFSHVIDAGIPWLPALLLAGLLTIPVGALVAVPAIRLSGLYLALATFGFGVLMQYMVFPTSLMFGTELSVSAPRPVFGFDGREDRTFYFVVLAVAVLTALALVAVNRGRLGRLLRAMAETPTMLATHGLRVNVTRLLVFCLSAFLAGVAGALRLAQSGTVGASEFGPIPSLLFLVVLAVAGAGLVRAPLIAALLLAVVPGYLTGFGANEQLLGFGLAALVVANLSASREGLDRWFGRAATSSGELRRTSPVRERLARQERLRARAASRLGAT